MNIDNEALQQGRDAIITNQPSLSEFWQADPKTMHRALLRRNIGAVVVKKHLIKNIPLNTDNMGAYPLQFIRTLDRLSFLTKKFSSDYADIYYIEP